MGGRDQKKSAQLFRHLQMTFPFLNNLGISFCGREGRGRQGRGIGGDNKISVLYAHQYSLYHKKMSREMNILSESKIKFNTRKLSIINCMILSIYSLPLPPPPTPTPTTRPLSTLHN